MRTLLIEITPPRGPLGKVGGTVMTVLPLPDPFVGLNITNVCGPELARHVGSSQTSGVTVTLIVREPPEAGKVRLDGDALTRQRAVCVMVSVWPATVIVPARCGFPGGLKSMRKMRFR